MRAATSRASTVARLRVPSVRPLGARFCAHRPCGTLHNYAVSHTNRDHRVIDGDGA